MNQTEPAASLPLDPDTEIDQFPAAHPLPIHVHPGALALVFLGGTLGAGTREALALLYPAVNGIPWTIFCINVSGAFLLGVLLEALVRRGPDHGRRRALRLLLGTGFMGGYTTYSSLATDTAALLGHGSPWAGAGYAIGTVLIGGLATWAGILLATFVHRRRTGYAA